MGRPMELDKLICLEYTCSGHDNITVTGLLMSFVYFFASPLLKLLGQDDEVADVAGVYAIWTLSQFFAYALNFPMQKFLLSQSKVIVVAWISLVTLLIHIFLCWLMIFKLALRLAGAAITANISLWVIDTSEFLYIIYYCQDAWKGFSRWAFQDIWSFVRLSLASGVMLWLL